MVENLVGVALCGHQTAHEETSEQQPGHQARQRGLGGQQTEGQLRGEGTIGQQVEHQRLRLLHIAQPLDVVERQILVDLIGRHHEKGQQAEFANVVGVECRRQAHGMGQFGGHVDQSEGFDAEIHTIIDAGFAHGAAEHAVHGGTQSALDVAHLGVEVGSIIDHGEKQRIEVEKRGMPSRVTARCSELRADKNTKIRDGDEKAGRNCEKTGSKRRKAGRFSRAARASSRWAQHFGLLAPSRQSTPPDFAVRGADSGTPKGNFGRRRALQKKVRPAVLT